MSDPDEIGVVLDSLDAAGVEFGKMIRTEGWKKSNEWSAEQR